jgi:hypothetical protein
MSALRGRKTGGISIIQPQAASSGATINQPIQTVSAFQFSTASITPLSTSIGVTSTAHPTTHALVTISLIWGATGATTSCGGSFRLYRSTTSIPAAGAGPNVGDSFLAVQVDQYFGTAGVTVTAGYNITTSFSYYDTGLTAGTNYYYYIATELIANTETNPNGNTYMQVWPI